MYKRLLITICMLTIATSAAMAQQPQTPPPAPVLMVPLPEGITPPPPDAGPQAFDDFLQNVFMTLAGDDGVLTLGEFRQWMLDHKPPMEEGTAEAPQEQPGSPAEGAPGDTMMPPAPPACCDELTAREAAPVNTNVPCGDTAGNLVFRTVCNSDGFNSQAISLPAGRTASCFGIEAVTPNVVMFSIYPEDDPGDVIFDSDRDGVENIGNVEISGDRVYRLDLDMDRSDPDARVTVRFVDHPDGT